jgi:hypothetical protein
MADRHTIWYATRPLDNQSCPDIVKLDLRTNARTVVAHASDFALTPDGTKLLLVFPKNPAAVAANCGVSVPRQYDDAFVVRDLATGAQSTLPFAAYPSAGTGGPSGPVWISPPGDRLIAGTCVEDGCATLDFAVPKNFTGAIVRQQGSSAPACGCGTLVSGPDGVYGIDAGGIAAPQTRLRRYDPAHVVGPGTVVVTSRTIRLTMVVPTAAGLFVAGGPYNSHAVSLYRVDNGALHLVTSLPSPLPAFFALRPVKSFAASN